MNTHAQTKFMFQKVNNKWWKCPTVNIFHCEKQLPIAKHREINEWVKYFGIGEL
jgi:hypothetical protein